MDAELRLRKFALRARRIAAHSLASDRGRLAEMANLRMTGTLNPNGQIEIRRELPDEESFESLAARVRPVLLNRESVHHGKVLTALEAILDRPGQDVDDLETVRAEVQRLRVAWSRHDESKPALHRYAVQRAKADGSESTLQVSDGKMALAWLYGDLVHVDVKGQKLDGTLLPIKERYAAAVSYFSDVALLCAQTLDVITDLARRGLLELGEDVMDVPVVVGSDELVDTGVAYLAPMGTPMPSLEVAMKGAPEGFSRLTPTELLRMEPRNHVLVRLEAEDGSLVAEYDAAVSGRRSEGDRLVWRALVAGCVTYEVTLDFNGEEVASFDCRVSVTEPTTNRMALDKVRFERGLYRCATMRFIVLGRDFFSLTPAKPTDDELRAIDISIDSLGDLVAIEEITGQRIVFASGSADYRQRAELRRIRLLWEGHVVPFTRGPLPLDRGSVPTNAPAGTAREVVVVPPGTRTFADAEYPSPPFLVRHPRMVAENVEPVPDGEHPQGATRMVVPSDEPFVAWVPDRATVKTDTDLVHPAPWGLSHFDTGPFLGSQWTDGQRLTL